MSKLYNHYPVKVLHLESTDVCQASCPLCERETNSDFDKNTQNHLGIAQLQSCISDDLIAKLDKMFICGNLGDPAAGKHTLALFSYFRHINPEITLGMNTNGAIQNTTWWDVLGKLFHKQHDYVVFSIDGLEDTNHIYRRGVNWQKLMENARAYIKTGARAHWDMLVYGHNEHQVDECESLAKKMGFTWFRAKVSKRPSTVDWLRPPKNWERPEIKQGSIECIAEQEKSIYVNSRGQVYPCCWLGSTDAYYETFPEIKNNWNTSSCNPICQQTCSSKSNQNNFSNQWQRNTQLL